MAERKARDLARSPEFLAGIRAGVAALNEGRITPWKEVARELGIGNLQGSDAMGD